MTTKPRGGGKGLREHVKNTSVFSMGIPKNMGHVYYVLLKNFENRPTLMYIYFIYGGREKIFLKIFLNKQKKIFLKRYKKRFLKQQKKRLIQIFLKSIEEETEKEIEEEMKNEKQSLIFTVFPLQGEVRRYCTRRLDSLLLFCSTPCTAWFIKKSLDKSK